MTSHEINRLAGRCLKLCDAKGWRRDWREGGCCLHLEVSEYIEALRGKRGGTIEEAGDVLFVLLSMLRHSGIDVGDVLLALDDKVGRMQDGLDLLKTTVSEPKED